MSEPDTLLNIDGLSFNFGAASTVKDLTLSVKRGEIVCILGASGCGKTTVLNLIAGLLKPQSGSISRPGNNNGSKDDNKTGYIFQADALFPWRTVEANLHLARDLGKGVKKNEAVQAIQNYLSLFHLSGEVLKKYPGELSGGMRQRVSIIQALMFDPELLLLDEPFSALDYYTKLSLESEFYQLVKEKGKAAVMVTHDIEEAVAMADRAFLMSDGKLAREFVIRDGKQETKPENARGSADFAGHYNAIWNELKASVSA